MENKHTQEPWENCGGAICKVTKKENEVDFEVIVDPAKNQEDTRRIVACVNACAGINTEALEHRVHLLKAEDDQIATLTKQRDELLSALERIAAGPGDNRLLTAIQWAKEAIDNVKGTNNV